MGDNIETYDSLLEPEEEVVLLSDLPQHYQNRLTELSEVIKALFTVEGLVGGAAGGVDSDVLMFLEMCHQIFDLDFNGQTESDIGKRIINDSCAAAEPSSSSSPVEAIDAAATELLNSLMGTYRSFFRKRFRGFTYLAPSALQDTFQLAYNKTRLAYFEKRKKNASTASEKVGIMSLLRNGMLQEFQWIQKVNEFKRQQLLDSVKAEVIQEFETEVKHRFATALFSEEKDDSNEFSSFYEEAELQENVDHLVKSAVEEFKKQVPYTEDAEDLTKMSVALEAELRDRIVRELLEKNSVNKENAESIMERLVEHSTNVYRDKLSKFVSEIPIVEPDQVLQRHLSLQAELVEKFEREECYFAVPKLHRQFLNLLNEGIHNSLKDILTHCNESGALMLAECEKRSKLELDKCMRRIAKIFASYGLSQYFDDLCEKVEANLKNSLDDVRYCTIINGENMEEILETAKTKLPVAVEPVINPVAKN